MVFKVLKEYKEEPVDRTEVETIVKKYKMVATAKVLVQERIK